MSTNNKKFIRIFVLDFYLNFPVSGLDVLYSEFKGAPVYQVPILRCFGSTEEGKKMCLHIHGVFPYLYVPYDGIDNIHQIASAIDKAINITMNQGSSTRQHIFKISIVSGIPMYGYHRKNQQFLKIYLYNPMLISTVSNLLLNKSIVDKTFQPHESHINFTLQFMMDYNLRGMSKMFISNLKYRNADRKSNCELEADVQAEHILNIYEKSPMNPGIAALWEDEKQRRRNKDEESQMGDFLNYGNNKLIETRSHNIFRDTLCDRLASTENDITADSSSLSSDDTFSLNDSILDASFVETHKLSQHSDTKSSQSNSSETSFLGDDALQFMHLLQDLAAEKDDEESILSQKVEESDDEEDEVDLSQSLILEESIVDQTLVEQDVTIVANVSQSDHLENHSEKEHNDNGLMEQSRSLINDGKKKLCATSSNNESNSSQNAFNKSRDNSFFDNTEIIKPYQECNNKTINNLSMEIDNALPSTSSSFIATPLNDDSDINVSSQICNKSNEVCSKTQEKHAGDDSYETILKVSASNGETINQFVGSKELQKITEKIGPIKAPSKLQISNSLSEYKLDLINYQSPFYGNVLDYSGGKTEIGRRVLKILSKTTLNLDDFDTCFDSLNTYRNNFAEKLGVTNNSNLELAYCTERVVLLRPIKNAPSKQCIESKIRRAEDEANSESPVSNGPVVAEYQQLNETKPDISGLTMRLESSAENLKSARVIIDNQYITMMIMELHVCTRGELMPDPEFDPISAIFYSIINDVPEDYFKPAKVKGAIVFNTSNIVSSSNMEINYVESEEDLINTLMSLIKYWDPDILCGYEIEMLSWGYLIERSIKLSMKIFPMLCRITTQKTSDKKPNLETDIIGRIVLDCWRILRHELALQSYTFESIVYHLLHKRIPNFSFKTLTFWWDYPTNHYRHKVVDYYSIRVEFLLEILNKLDYVNRTSELARLFGILFYEVLSRGSQFRVESMMLRLAKPQNFIPVSPSVLQRSQMKAPEFVPLILEPESRLYNDPVIVLDFQSLYPSIIIAYNYCFTTCLGRVRYLGTNQPFNFGATNLKVSRELTKELLKRDLLNFSPCGVAFVRKKLREGILPRMLYEILETRLMVKSSMKENKGDKILEKVLYSRQLGLKLIANVTYGYTAANFSGRMCCVEIGDSILSKARETLQRAIDLVETTPEWGARVVYGDTDSLFVQVPGRTRKEAFEIGGKIAETITNANPNPVKLKLEKVYQPCILQTKKRYVGYAYESVDQAVPVYDAKGIETVRRDGCPAVSKMLQKCLTILFDTMDVSLVKAYVERQFRKILTGRLSIQDLIFAKEYRGFDQYKPGACVPALELAKKRRTADRRNEPRRSERVPYIIINGPPGYPLIRLVRDPMDLLVDQSLRPNALYYITKVIIPPLNRCLNLIGADVANWYNQMPRHNIQQMSNWISSPLVKSTISQYFAKKSCASCLEQCEDEICEKCCRNVNETTITLFEKIRIWEQKYYDIKLICENCSSSLNEIKCISLDCPILYRRIQAFGDFQQSSYIRGLLNSKKMFAAEDKY